MGKCVYCGEEAGLLKNKHKACEDKYHEGVKQISEVFTNAALSANKLPIIDEKIFKISKESFVNEEKIEELRISSWESAVEDALSDDLFTEAEEDALISYKKHFNLSQDELNENGYYFKIAKAAIIRELCKGIIPNNVKVEGNLPFNFMKSEDIVWLFPQVNYYERRTRKQYEGGHQGVSLRVAKGVYYRTGSFRGNPVNVEEVLYIDSGPLAITTKHIYFGGTKKSFRIKFDKIVAVHPYDDGIGVQRDATTAKPQIFVTGDGWFTYNLVSNLLNIE